MRRAHNAQEAISAVKRAQDAGYEQLTLDLIYGTPGLTDKGWLENLNTTKELAVPHFSAYALTVEEGTLLHRSIAKKKATPVDAAQSAAQMDMLMDFAETSGYEQYEISNFATPNNYAKHNTAYWQAKPYIGIGPSAHGYNGGKKRRWNIANNALYIKSLLVNEQIPYEEEILTNAQQCNEYIMTSLRTQWGCDTDYINQRWRAQQQVLQEASTFIAEGKMIAKDNILLLTKDGKFFADYIAASLFIDE
jgi:oxygen-independent coproporphyrinogen-3 oxidase